MRRLQVVGIALMAAVISGCARQTVQSAVDAGTGLGAVRTKFERVDPQLAELKCRTLCETQLVAGSALAAGPCLGDPIPGIADWVCDVTHRPRRAVDDDPGNQCAAYRDGRARHFVEVDEECNVIKTY